MASLGERQQMLLDDPDISVVEPHRVFCNRCGKWLKLDETKLYSASIWRCHKSTKSHISRPPNLLAPDPQLLKDGKVMVPSQQRDTDKVQLRTDNEIASSTSALDTLDTPAEQPPMLRVSSRTASRQASKSALPQLHHRTGLDGSGLSEIAVVPNVAASATTGRTTLPQGGRSSPRQACRTTIHRLPSVNEPDDSSLSPTVTATSVITSRTTTPQNSRKSLPGFNRREKPNGSSSSAIPAASAAAASTSTSNTVARQTLRKSLPGVYKRRDKVNGSSSSTNAAVPTAATSTSTNRTVALQTLKKSLPSLYRKDKPNDSSSSAIAASPTVPILTLPPPMTRKMEPSRLHGAGAQSNDSPPPECNLSQETLPPPLTPLVAKKCVIVPPEAQSNPLGSPTQPPGPLPTRSTSNLVTRIRSVSVSGRDGEAPWASTSASRAAILLGRLSPHRKASYRALAAETYIGNLEPFRAFCTLCDRWVNLSSRTPYSYGVWKGHVRKTDKHNRLQTGNIQDDYDTASDHSHEDLNAPVDVDCGLNVDNTPATNEAHMSSSANDNGEASITSTNGHNETLMPSTLSLLKVKPDICSLPVDQNIRECTPGLEAGRLQPQDTNSLSDLRNAIALNLAPEVNSSADLSPLSLVATAEDSFGRGNCLEQGDLPQSKESQLGFFEGDGMPILTESSEEEPSKRPSTSQSTPLKPPALLALEKRRAVMLSDPDVAIVESRRVKCGLCDRWIKGSNTQEYSSHHWLKHKRKCTRIGAEKIERYSESAEARKTQLEADSSLNILEPHRALCGLCKKWVKLCNRSLYSASHWVQHKKKCLAQQNRTETSVQQEPAESSALSGNEQRSYHKVPPPPTTPESRRAALAADPDVLQLFPDRVQCRPCGRWIKLSLPVEYSPSHWLNHKEACPGYVIDSPSRGLVALERRKKILEEDPDIAEIEPHRVRCAVCNLWVRLRHDCSYSLGKWERHQKRCGRHAGSQMKNGHEADKADNESDDIDDDQEAMDVEIVLQGTSNGTRNTEQHSSSCECDDDDVEMTENQLSIPPWEESANRAEESHDNNQRDIEAHDTVEIRRRNLLEDPDVLEVEPWSVLCRRCQLRVELEGPDSYMIKKWLAHKAICHSRAAYVKSAQSENVAVRKQASRVSKMQSPETRKNPAVSRPIRPLPRSKGKAPGQKRAPSPMTLPPLPPRPRWPGEDERKQQFLDDPDVERIEPHRLLCKHCNCWIKLHPIIRYSQSVWPRHKMSCKDIQLVVPGDARIRARSEKEDARKQMLDDDAYATDISPHRVTCKACGTNIRLDTTYKYEGSHWRAHRARCPRIPFHDRASKKRRERRARDGFQNFDSPSRVLERVATIDSSDSDDSDASSVPRPRPTSFFTAPLQIDPTQMFTRRSRAIRPSAYPRVIAAKAQTEMDIATHLHMIAEELISSDRLMAVIESAGNSVTSNDLLVSEMQHNVDKVQEDDISGLREDLETLPIEKRSPEPDLLSWIPRKRTREEETEFDSFFRTRPAPATPPRENSKVRVCKLGKDAMEVVD